MAKAVPSPALASLTANTLLRRIHQAGGRIFRMREICVFCLTTDEQLAKWLLELGGYAFARGGSYLRDSVTGKREWDIYIHTIPVSGAKTIWEAADGKATEWEVGDPK